MYADPAPPTQNTLRAVVIGCGWIGAGTARDASTVGIQSHAEAYARHPRITLAGVADQDLARAKSAAAAFGAYYVFKNPTEMLKELRPEIVSICTPDESHAEMLRVALSMPATRAILMEKPLATQIDEARHLVQQAEEKRVILSVNYSRRFSPAFRQLRKELSEGIWGRIQHVHGWYGKGIIHNGTHWIDLLRFLIGEISHASASTRVRADSATPSVEFLCVGGIPATLGALDHQAFTLFEMDIIATAGRIRILDGGHRILRSRTCESPLYVGYINLGREEEQTACLKDAIVHAIDDLIICLDDPSQCPACTGSDALTCLETAVGIAATLKGSLA